MKKVCLLSLFVLFSFVSEAQKVGCACWYVEGVRGDGDTIIDRSVEVRLLDIFICEEYKEVYEKYVNWTAYYLDGSGEGFENYVPGPGIYLLKAFFCLTPAYKGAEYVPFSASFIYDYRLYPKGDWKLAGGKTDLVLGTDVKFVGNHYLRNKFKKIPKFEYTYYIKKSDTDSAIYNVGDKLPNGDYTLYALLHDSNNCYVDWVFSTEIKNAKDSCAVMESPVIHWRKD